MKLLLTALAATTLFASPVLAQDNSSFTGVRTELTAGFNDITNSPDLNNVVYGAALGVDFPVGNKVTFGVEANASNVFERTRTIGAAARVGYAVNSSNLLYVKGGYTNYRDVFRRNLDGLVAGAGIEHKISDRTYIKAQYDYSNFAKNTGSHAGLVGVGIRF